MDRPQQPTYDIRARPATDPAAASLHTQNSEEALRADDDAAFQGGGIADEFAGSDAARTEYAASATTKPAPAQAPAEGADDDTPEDPRKPAPAQEPAEGPDDIPAD